MVRKLHILFLLLSLLALCVIGFDYVCGHMSESPLKPNQCPLCAAFQSTELGHLTLISLTIFFLLPFIGYYTNDRWFSPHAIHLVSLTLRAPPDFS